MNDGRHSAACHEAGRAVVAWSFGLEVGAAQAHDVGAGDVKISSDGNLPLVDQTAICLAGHQAQELTGGQMFDHQSICDRMRIRDILIEYGIAGGPLTRRIREAARKKAHDILKSHRDTLIKIADELMPSGQLSAERMAVLLAPRR
jgi:hypothetical protein